MQEEMTLTKGTMKALSSDVRLKILKKLEEKQQTQTDLAFILQLKVPTIKEHLNLLQQEGLVTVKEEGRKWKYYHLTEKGLNLINPENRFVKLLLFSFSGFTFATAITLYLRFKQQNLAEKSTVVPELLAMAAPTVKDIQPQSNMLPLLTGIFIILATLSLILFFYFKKNLKTYKSKKNHK